MLADLILIAILVLNILLGIKHGFFVMLGRLILFILSLGVTVLLAGPLSSLLAKAPFLAPLADKLSEHVLGPLQQTATSIGATIDSFNLPPLLSKFMQSQFPTLDSSVNQAYAEFSSVLLQFALNAVIFIIMFIIISILIHLLARVLTKLADKLPLVGTANRLGGLLSGLVLGLIQVSIILLVLGFLTPYLPSIASAISDSRIAAYFYSINILAYLL